MNTYLIASETIYFQEEKLKELKGDTDNIITFNMLNDTMADILSEASYLSMFDSDKCVIVKNAKIFSPSSKDETNKTKVDSEKLLKYWENENPHTKLIFLVMGKVDGKKKIVSKLKENNNLFVYPSLNRTEVKNKLKEIVTKDKYTIDDKSLWHIINRTNGNLDLAINEIKKIELYYSKSGKIDYNDVVNLTAKVVEENNFKLIDSIIAKDLDNALNYLEEANTLKVEPSVILALVYREFKLMLSILIYEEKREPLSNILNNLKLQEWQYQKVKDNLRNYHKNEIMEEIIKLSDLDYKYKSGILNKDMVLITYIIDLCL